MGGAFASFRRSSALEAVGRNWKQLEHVVEELRADKEVVLAAIRSDAFGLEGGCALQWASSELKSDKEVVLEAVTLSFKGAALQYASAELCSDAGFVTAALQRCGHALQFVDERLRADRVVVREALHQSRGLALQYAAAELRSDREIVLLAVGLNPVALQYASKGLQAEKEVVLAAVGGSMGLYALEHAAEELRSDKDVILAALQDGYGLALEYAPETFKGDAQLLREVVTSLPEEFKECFIFHITLLSGRSCGCVLPGYGLIRSNLLGECARKLDLDLCLLRQSAQLVQGETIFLDDEAIRHLGCGQVHELQLVLQQEP